MNSYTENSFSIKTQTNTFYQPNFILIAEGNYSPYKNAFGDILPIYKSSYELASIVVSTKESLLEFIIYSKVFLICTLSLLSEIINSAVYQAYLTALAVYDSVSTLPRSLTKIQTGILEIIEMISSEDTRELWWINAKLDIYNAFDRLLGVISETLKFLKKFYLCFLVFIVLAVLSIFAGGKTGNNENLSFLSRAIDNHSFETSQVRVSQSQIANLSSFSYSPTDESANQKVIHHLVKKGETIETIAEMYGLKMDTVKFNNQLKTGKNLPSKLYLPWKDGYLYKVNSDNVTPESLGKMYSINKDLIYSENEDSFDHEKKAFEKGSVILLPSTNFNLISRVNNEQKKAIKDAKNKNLLTKNSSLVANIAGYKKTAPLSFSSQPRKAGFIWPASGYISRCVQPGHVACDIANPSAPPIFAVQDGVIKDVYRFTVRGYGLAVLIDHGNGITTLYAHMSDIYVAPGQKVQQGQAIGKMGCTGSCTGTHVHFEVRINGTKQNPLLYLS